MYDDDVNDDKHKNIETSNMSLIQFLMSFLTHHCYKHFLILVPLAVCLQYVVLVSLQVKPVKYIAAHSEEADDDEGADQSMDDKNDNDLHRQDSQDENNDNAKTMDDDASLDEEKEETHDKEQDNNENEEEHPMDDDHEAIDDSLLETEEEEKVTLQNHLVICQVQVEILSMTSKTQNFS